jgi:hypothetical protein
MLRNTPNEVGQAMRSTIFTNHNLTVTEFCFGMRGKADRCSPDLLRVQDRLR